MCWTIPSSSNCPIFPTAVAPMGAIWAYYDQPTPNSSNNVSPAIASVAQRTAAPVPTVAGGFYPTGQSVEFAATTAAIYYTLDGSIPTTAATLYTGAPIAVADTAVLGRERMSANSSAPSPPKPIS
ncbi:MAG: chitobiase/beta-hexosaminidase C-terminal domain-containing protein [Chloroflexi bacterium]|nr:chitobiase/beta-hexosaminidase C-terminal domain-containing protein [Chloroflexota bacterium]